MAFWQWTALTAAAAALPYARDRDALPSCAALDDVAAELSRLPNVFGARRAELRELASPPLPGYRSQCFVHSPTNLPAADEAFSFRDADVWNLRDGETARADFWLGRGFFAPLAAAAAALLCERAN